MIVSKDTSDTMADSPSSQTRPIVAMTRTDGLGERLCAMMNALRFADVLGTDFGFHWTSDLWNPVYHKLDVDRSAAVLGQSIAPQEEIFSEAFIEAYAITSFNPKAYRNFPPKPITLDKIRRAAETGTFAGWQPNQHFMEDQCDPKLMKKATLSYGEAFDRIGFSDAITAVITAARAIELAPFHAIHLRSGDMVFGEVRKWGQWNNKVLNLSVAADLIRRSAAQGCQVMLFGQDTTALRKLAAREGCLFVGDLLPSADLSPTHRALFEIALMARADRIMAGYSGFSRAACMIAGIKATTPMSLYKKDEYADLTLKDLDANGDDYHPIAAAYSYWQSYAVGKDYFNLPGHLAMIEKAQALDPENLLYPVIRAGILYRMGQDAAAEGVVAEVAAKTGQDVETARVKMTEQLVFKYYSTDFTHRDEFPAFQGAALRSGNTNATYFAAAIKKALA